MNKIILLALSLTAAGFSAQAQTSAAKPATTQAKANGPQIQFEEMKYDFGSIKTGDVVEHTFKFKNVGTQPLIISNIGVSCGCTTPAWTKEPIMPGKTGTITAKFNSAGKMGMQNKVLTVESNSAGGNAMVALVGDVKEATVSTDAAAEASAAPAAPAAATAAPEAKEVKQKTKVSEGKVKAKRKS